MISFLQDKITIDKAFLEKLAKIPDVIIEDTEKSSKKSSKKKGAKA
jgi:hypothetical protein